MRSSRATESPVRDQALRAAPLRGCRDKIEQADSQWPRPRELINLEQETAFRDQSHKLPKTPIAEP
jgi:hypothetical protein